MKSLINDKLGYYIVGSQRIESKIDACVMATKQNLHPIWNFNNQTWQAQNWQHEPQCNILDLYQARAKQIRDRYDYVILNYSGGSDSQTMVDAFLDSNSFIDEIVTIWNRRHTAKVIARKDMVDSRNIEAEFDLTTRSGLDRIKSRSPQTKITYIDVSDATIDSYQTLDGEEWLSNTVEHLHPQYVTRWSATRDKQQLITMDRGLRTAVLFGVDKPRICIKDGQYCAYFIDVVANSFRGGFNRPEYDNLDYVFFYWTPDMPEIVIKQSHLIKNWFESNEQLKPILHWGADTYNTRQAYETIVRSIIYPRWDLCTFQCLKTTSTVYSEWDDWFFKEFQGAVVYDNWYKGIEFVIQHVDQKYQQFDFQNRFNGLIGMINGFFPLNSHK